MPSTVECVIALHTHCSDCAARTQKRIQRIGGVTEARIEHPEGRAVFRYDPSVIPVEDARAAVEKVASATVHRHPAHGHGQGGIPLLWAAAALWLVGIVLLLAGVSAPLIGSFGLPNAFLVLAVLVGGGPIFRGAVRSVRRLRLGVHALIALAVVGAAALGEFFEAASLVVLFGASEWLEHRAKGRAHHMIEDLLDCAPDTAIALRECRQCELPVEAIDVGERIVVRPGDRIGLDGTVATGSSRVDEAPITGESIPVPKSAGDTVYAGTLNGDGGLEVIVERDAGSSTIARVAELVSNAVAERPRIQRVVDRFATVYTPIVVGAASLVILVPLALGVPIRPWILRALSLLVISCPCAFIISLPATMAAALSLGARNGLIIKGGEHLERAAKTSVMAFDKTGTLTTGDLTVEVVPAQGRSAKDVLRLAGALESISEHSIGRAIVRGTAGMDLPNVTGFRAIPGMGVRGTIEGTEYVLGRPDLLSRDVLDASDVPWDDARMVLLGTETELLGGFRLQDRIRPEVCDVVADLERLGVRSVMVTGDRRRVAEACAASAGIREIHSDLLPDDKHAVVKRLRDTDTVCMVGDGINDAPSLAAADVGIAMGLSAAITAEAGDIVLSDEGLHGLPRLIRLARKAFRIARLNMAVALALKAAVAILSFAGISSLALAVIVGDVGATLLVTLNAVRLARARLDS